jgi:hypothetical protein
MSQYTSKQLIAPAHNNVRGASTSTTDILVYQESRNRAEVVPGIELQIPSSLPNQDAIQVVYAPTASQAHGLVLLLHACTHSALKFFSSSSTCPECVGLSEELRIVRLLLEKGYIPVSVSCVNRKRGCWTNPDHDRILKVLQHQLFANHSRVYAIGASSGGSFAAQLLVRGVVDGALVMVMSLGNEVVGKLHSKPKPLYLAPMPRDKKTTAATINNYQYLKGLNTEHKQMIILDTKSCDSLPVTRSYLQERVPGMSANIADRLISSLLQEKHLDASQMLIVDPTKSNWREIISPDNSTHWLNKFVLKPGYSPLAKALHRAWAYHEYCSEVVVPALELFESNPIFKQ